jgi:ParB/RepB/Spo0J family partition protein
MTPQPTTIKSNGTAPQPVPAAPAVPLAARLAAAAPPLGAERLDIQVAAGAEEREIPVALIDTDENARKFFDPKALQELADSIAANGLLNSLLVYAKPNGRFGLIAGGRRLLSVRDILRWEKVRSRVLTQPPDPAKRSVLVLADNDREDLDDIEKGMAYLAHTIRFQCSATALAKQLGCAVSSVTRPMQLAQKIAPDLRELVGSGPGKLPPFAARLLIRLPEADQRKFAQLYCDGKVKTAAELAAAIRNGNAAPAGFAWEAAGVKVSVTLPGGDLAAAEAVLKGLLKDLKDHAAGGVAQFRTYLAKKAVAARKAEEARAAREALSS